MRDRREQLRADEEFRAFAVRRAASLHRAALLLAGDRGHAEDLVQVTLLKVYKSWDQVRAAESPDAYVRRILVNCHLTERRRHRLVELLTSAVPEPAPLESRYVIEEIDGLRDALAALPARQRAAVVLRHYLGLTETEAAAALKTSVGNVKSLTSRGIARLRVSLSDAPSPALSCGSPGGMA